MLNLKSLLLSISLIILLMSQQSFAEDIAFEDFFKPSSQGIESAGVLTNENESLFNISNEVNCVNVYDSSSLSDEFRRPLDGQAGYNFGPPSVNTLSDSEILKVLLPKFIIPNLDSSINEHGIEKVCALLLVSLVLDNEKKALSQREGSEYSAIYQSLESEAVSPDMIMFTIPKHLVSGM